VSINSFTVHIAPTMSLFKALTAQKEGAAAILIYSDPAEDGYKKGKVFPEGPWGPENHIQHGAITYDFMVPGDPLTPGWASVPGAKRIAVDQAVSLPKIMALPLSWHDAKPLLDRRQQQYPGVRGHQAAIKRHVHRLARDRWQTG